MSKYLPWTLLFHYFKEVFRTKWLVSFSVVFFLLVLDIPVLILMALGYLSSDYLSTYLSFVATLSFPYLPLLALPIGAISIVQERESGSLGYLMSTKITRHGFLLAKGLGLMLGTGSVVVIGYGAASIVAIIFGFVDYYSLLQVILIALFLNAIMLALGLFISLASSRKETALGFAIFAWFLFAVISNLGQVGPLLIFNRSSLLLTGLALLDPIESSRILAIIITNGYLHIPPPNLVQLGPTGAVLLNTFKLNSVSIVVVSLILWLLFFALLCFWIFRRQDA